MIAAKITDVVVNSVIEVRQWSTVHEKLAAWTASDCDSSGNVADVADEKSRSTSIYRLNKIIFLIHKRGYC